MKRWIVRILATVGTLAISALVVGAVYVGSVMRGGLSARDQPSMLEARVARAARSFSTSSRAKSLKSPLAPSDAVLDRGRAHWADHCALCHANDGSGDTP